MNRTRIILLFTCFLLVSAARVASQDADTGEALISRARLVEDIWAERARPILMEVEIEVPGLRGAPSHGSYTLNWVSPLQWREEIRFGGYERLRVRDAKGYWQRSGLSYQPEIIFHLDNLLHPKELLKLAPKQGFGKVKSRGKDQGREKCVEVKWTKATDRVLCFEETTGALQNVEYPEGENQHLPEISRIEYRAFHAVGDKFFPYQIQALQERRVLASLNVLRIAETEHDPAIFKVPVNAEFWEYCDDMQQPELTDRSHPAYPESARSNHEQGRVMFYAVIETDGSVSHVATIHRAPRSIEAAALETVRRWRYTPAECGQRPIRKETLIEMDFWMQY